MANTIVLEQHWYGSAPLGLAASRGFQTIARSRGLAQDAGLETHCVYRRPTLAGPVRPPPGREPLPVNWGWFPLDRERVVVHRIGYAGTDEGGRPGNFLAHNLIVRRADLEQVDFDIPTLFHWVSRFSPIRYTLDDGSSNGFPRNYRHLYAQHGQDRQKLQNIEPLEVPAAALLQLRREIDAGAHEEFLGVLPDLLRCLLCPPEQRRLILVAGLSQGEDDSARERRLLDLLFGLLPFPCRETLSYATYESEPAALLTPPRAGTVPPPFRQRRLFLVPAGVDLRLPNNPQLWLLNLNKPQVLAPQASFLAEGLAAAIQGDAREHLSAWRKVCTDFTGASGLAPLEALWRLTRKDRKLTAGELADAWALPLPNRAGRSEIRELLGGLLLAAEGVCGPAAPERSKLGLRYLELLQLTPPSSPELVDGTPGSQALACLCRWGLQEGQAALFAGLLELLVASPACPGLDERVAAALVATQTLLDSVEQFHALVECWVNQLKKTPVEQARLLPVAGETLLRVLISAEDELAQKVKPEAILVLLQRSRIPNSADLERLLRLLRQLPPENELVSRTGKVLALALRDGRIPTRVVEELTGNAALALLRLQPLWLALAQEEAVAGLTLEERLRDPRLFQRFCEALPYPDAHACDGLRWLIHELLQKQHQEQRRKAVVYYEDQGSVLLIAQLGQAGAKTPLYLTATHIQVLSFARRKEMPTLGLEAHLCALLGVLLVHPDRQQSGEQLGGVLGLWLRWYPEPEGRVAILDKALAERPASPPQTVPPELETMLVDRLLGLGLEEQEALWCGRYLYLGLSEPAEDPARLRDRTTVDLLLAAPNLVAAVGTPFQQWFAVQLHRGVLNQLAERVALAWQEADADELQAWFVEDSKKRLLCLLSQQRLLAGPGEALADCCRSQSGWLGLALLGKLLQAVACRQERPPPNLQDFLARTSAGLLQVLFGETEILSAAIPAGKGGLVPVPRGPR